MITYKDAGVDKEEGYRSVELMKRMVKKTHNSNVLTGLGSFGAMYQLGKYKEPILISGTDGVGTKLEVAIKLGRYDTVGIDCVAMCVNDILCHGAKPLFFLDYIGCGKLSAETASSIVKGIADGCLESNAALIGGETAEMPGFYKDGDYDIAGFTVGVVEKTKLIDGSKVGKGDRIIGLPSSGLHSNGYSLVRKVISDYNEKFNGKTMGEELLTPTKIYVKEVSTILDEFEVHGLAHITGGGVIENLPRTIPDGLCGEVLKNTFPKMPIYTYLMDGRIAEEEMWGTFNMGIGFILIVKEENLKKIVKRFQELGTEAIEIGKIIEGPEKICLR